MIPGLAAVLPASLASFAPRLAVGSGYGERRIADVIASRQAFRDAIEAFARTFPKGDERAILSYWTQFYFAALIIPVAVTTIRLRVTLPLALDAMRCDLNADGLVERFWLPDGGKPEDDAAMGLGPLAADHLRPFIERCACWSGLSCRTLWCNAGTMLDYALREVGCQSVREKTICGSFCSASKVEGLMLAPYRSAPLQQTRRRAVCCLRCRLPGVADCGDICPLKGSDRSCAKDAGCA